VNTVDNAWVYLALTSLVDLGRLLGRSSQASQLDALAADMQASFNTLFYNGSGVVCDGVCSNTPHTSAHASFYALYAPTVAAFISARIAQEGDLGVPCMEESRAGL
jgi:hypothetical protein